MCRHVRSSGLQEKCHCHWLGFASRQESARGGGGQLWVGVLRRSLGSKGWWCMLPAGGNWWHWQEVGDTSCHQLKVRGGISLPTLRSQVMPMHSEHEEMRYGSRTVCDSGCNCLLCYLRCHKETEKHETRKQRMWDTSLFKKSRVMFSSLFLPLCSPPFSVTSYSGSMKAVHKDA